MVAVLIVGAFIFIIIPGALTHCAMYVFGWRDPRLRLLVFIIMALAVWDFVNGRGPGGSMHVATLSAR